MITQHGVQTVFSGDSVANEGFAVSQQQRYVYSRDKPKPGAGAVFDIQTKHNHEEASIPI